MKININDKLIEVNNEGLNNAVDDIKKYIMDTIKQYKNDDKNLVYFITSLSYISKELSDTTIETLGEEELIKILTH